MAFLFFFYSFSFYFLYSFSFYLLSFWKTHWPSILGNHNLLQVVNETRVGLHEKRVMQFLRLLKKTNVHSVWLAKGGRKRLNIRRLQLTNHLIMHGTNLVSMALGNVSISQLKGKAKPQKKWGQKCCKRVKKLNCLTCIAVCITKFSVFFF